MGSPAARGNPTLIVIPFACRGVVSLRFDTIHGKSNGVDHHHDYSLTNTSLTRFVSCWTDDACSATRHVMNGLISVTCRQWSCVWPKGFGYEFVPAVSQRFVECLGIAAFVIGEDHGEGLIKALRMPVE